MAKKNKSKANKAAAADPEVVKNEEQQPPTEEVSQMNVKETPKDDLDALMDEWGSDDDKPKKKKGKGKNQPKKEEEPPKTNGNAEAESDDDEDEEGSSTVLTAAQKKKLKKERQKAKKQQQNKQGGSGNANKTSDATTSEAKNDDSKTEDQSEGEISRLEKKAKLNSKEKMKLEMLKRIRDQQIADREAREAEERRYQEEQRKIEEANRKLKEEEERKKQKLADKKERKRLKMEADRKAGIAVTKAEKEKEAKRKALLESRGINVDEVKKSGGLEKPKRTFAGAKNKKKAEQKKDKVEEPASTPELKEKEEEEEEKKSEEVESEGGDSWDDSEKEDQKDEESGDDWDSDSDEEKEKEAAKPAAKKQPEPKSSEPKAQKQEVEIVSIPSDTKSLMNVKDDPKWANLDPYDRVAERNKLRKKVAKKNINLDVLRAPVICVLGHVDTGKTKILDNLRKTNVQDGEAGGITQQIGATNVNINTVTERTSFVKELEKINIPGLLIIDTPGHESFANLRTRGSSLCDLAILVVDIMHSLEPQTLESIELLKKGKTPFIIALNKIDRLYEWKGDSKKDIRQVIAEQSSNCTQDFEKRWNTVFLDFAQKCSLNVELFWKNKDPGTSVKDGHFMNVVPTSAHSGDGMGNLMALCVKMAQEHLTERVAFSEKVQCTVLEVKSVVGLGTTIDCILTQGRLKYGDHIILAGAEGPIVTQVKGLIMPKADKDLRVTTKTGGGTEIVKEVSAANGIRILSRDPIDKALAGTTLHVAYGQKESLEEEINFYKQEVEEEIERGLEAIKCDKTGVYVQASTLGALEALACFLRENKVPYFAVNVGPVHKKDVMKASTMQEIDPQWSVILAFDVKVEREAREYADQNNIKIFTADIIYHLFDCIEKYTADYIAAKKEEFKHKVKFPCQLEMMPQHIVRNRDPIIVGCKVTHGQVRIGTTLMALNLKKNLRVVAGTIAGLELNNKAVDIAKNGDEVCIKIEGAQGEAPKLLGRHFEVTDILVSKIDREGIELLKSWYKDEMRTSDWKLVVRLKKLLDII